MDAFCAGDVAVVGNGPLSEEDRTAIDAHDCVSRFNSVANRRKGERFDVHVSRRMGDTFAGMDRNDGRPVVPVTVSEDLAYSAPELVGKTVLPPLLAYERQLGSENTQPPDRRLFEHSRCGDECAHASSDWGPSTGAMAIDVLDKSPHVRTIDVYGMNWNGDPRHIDFKHPNLVPTHCTKCHIHRTASNTYSA